MKKIYLVLFLIGTLISCDKKQDPIIPNVVTYPMTIGSQWTYDRQIVINRYESKTSKKIVSTDAYDFVNKVWVDKDTVLNGKQVVKFIAEDEGFKQVNFHFIDHEGLKTYAHINGGLVIFAQAGLHLKSAVLDKLTQEDPIFYEQAPVMNLKFPLQTGLRWTYRPPTEFSHIKIEKQVTGTETLNLAGERFDCFKIDWIYSNDSTYDHLQITDWVSAKGLIKRTGVFDNVTIQNENGEPIGYGQSIETLTLKAVEIK